MAGGLLAYFRRMPDGNRFLYGSRASPFDVSPERAASVLYRRMVATFPQLDGARIRHAWGCKVGFTFDGLPHLGEINGLHYIMGCNGNGVAMMNYLGYKLARKMIDPSGDAVRVRSADLPDLAALPWQGLVPAAGVERLRPDGPQGCPSRADVAEVIACRAG